MKRFFIYNAVLLLALIIIILFFLNYDAIFNGKKSSAIGNVYRGALSSEPRTLDPAETGDVYSTQIITKVYESLYEYHPFKVNTYEVMPLLAESLPVITDGGKTYTITIKKGIYFQDDPCFEKIDGKGREVTAEDFVYSLMRVADLKNRSQMYFIFEGRIVGLDEWRSTTSGNEPSDYSVSIPGLRALDRYTIQFHLTKPVPFFVNILAMANTCVVSREAVEYYGEEFRMKPVGTGPYIMQDYVKNSHIHLVRNPNYHPDYYPSDGDPGDLEAGLLEDAGKQVPFIDEIYYYIIKQSQPIWLKFLHGELDTSGIPKDNFSEAITANKELQPDFIERGITLHTYTEPVIFYSLYNMRDPVVGGETNRVLRQAMSLAYNRDFVIDVFYNGRGIIPTQPVPVGVIGYLEDYTNKYAHYDPELARQMLIDAGYDLDEGIDVEIDTVSGDTFSRQMAENFKRMMAEIGINVKINYTIWSKYLEKLYSGGGQIYNGSGWSADYPDAENFYQLLVTGTSANHGYYSDPEFDRLYQQTAVMMDSPERDALFRQMAEIFERDMPWLLTFTRVSFALKHPWVENYKLNDFCDRAIKYRKINLEVRKEYVGY